MPFPRLAIEALTLVNQSSFLYLFGWRSGRIICHGPTCCVKGEKDFSKASSVKIYSKTASDIFLWKTKNESTLFQDVGLGQMSNVSS